MNSDRKYSRDTAFDEEKHIKLTRFKHLNRYAVKHQTVFTGSSLMEQFPICELFDDHGHAKDHIIYNRGIGGYTSDEFLRDMDVMLLDLEPSIVFINIGTNDMNADNPSGVKWLANLLSNYDAILEAARTQLPNAEIFTMAYYPVNTRMIKRIADPELAEKFSTRSNTSIHEANRLVRSLAEKHSCRYIDVNSGLYDDNGELLPSLSVEGVHLYPDAYKIIFDNLKPYIFDR